MRGYWVYLPDPVLTELPDGSVIIGISVQIAVTSKLFAGMGTGSSGSHPAKV